MMLEAMSAVFLEDPGVEKISCLTNSTGAIRCLRATPRLV